MPVADIEFDTTTPSMPEVRRVVASDLDRVAVWLVPNLVRDYQISPVAAFRWMREWALTNEFCFVCTDHAAALATVTHEAMRPTATVQQVFLYVNGAEHKGEGLAIYRHFNLWRKMIGATRFQFDPGEGAPMGDVRRMFPGLLHRKLFYVDNG